MINPTQTGCAILIGDPAVNMVSTAYDKYTAFASQAYNLATREIGQLQGFNIAPVQFSVSYNLDDGIFGYQRPTAPTAPADLTYHAPASAPDAPTVRLAPVAFDAAPSEPNNPAPVAREFTEPGNLTAKAPSGTITLKPVPTVMRPDYVLPSVPTLEKLNLPAAPTLNLPEFKGERPDTNLDVPVEDFSFTPEQYTSALLDKVSGRIGSMIDGDGGLPVAIAQALRDRAFAALDGQEYRAIQQATEEFGTRGFSEPNGMLRKTLNEVRQNNQNQRSAASRDIFIQEEAAAREDLKFAVTQGVALESQLIQSHNAYMQVSLSAAQAAQDMRLRVFEARVSLVNLNLQAYQVDAQVWREQLQGELAKLEVYRTELQALQVKGELNLQQVQLYEGQLRGVAQLAELYRTDLEAARLVVATNQQQIDLERAQIQNYAEQVNAYKAEWDTYATKLGSNTVKANIYNLVEQGFSTRLRGWSDAQQQKISQQQLSISEADLRERTWRGQLDKQLAEIRAETERLNAVDGIYRSKVAVYSASAQVETAASDANLRKLQLASERERSRTDVALRNAEIAINQMVEVNRLRVSVKQGIATVSSQLAASSMSAVNFSAGVHSGRSQSQSCSTGFSYSGSLDDTPAN